MDYFDSFDNSWIDLMMKESSKKPLSKPKSKELYTFFDILENIRKLNLSFDKFRSKLNEEDIRRFQDTISNKNPQLEESLRTKIRNDLLSVMNDDEKLNYILNYKNFLKRLKSYSMTDSYRIKLQIYMYYKKKADKNFVENIRVDGLDNILKSAVELENKNTDDEVEQDLIELKELYDAYYFEIVKAKSIHDFLVYL